MIVTQTVQAPHLALVYHSSVTQPVPHYAQTQPGLFPLPNLPAALKVRPIVNPAGGYLGQINQAPGPAPVLSGASAALAY